ncbi:helitron helicase-like domain-containing protein [Artemisia annua]|uniref:Helitron helicase-like domain-containing protein n=1 Tax=Artemisia annua TaxID=35608 RepID=A0A2U1L8A1_ARTAN|nr:helitron helicase-like domain-containing protein [Artemisia annua]
MHSLHVNSHRPFGDVSGLERQGSAEDEVPCVSHCGQQTFYGHNEPTLIQHNLCGSSRAVVNNSDYDSGFGKVKTAYSGGTTSGNLARGFQIYDNTSFQAKGSIPYNIEPSCLAYTETARTTSGNLARGFQIYDNTSFQAKGSIPYNIEPSCLAYTETARTYSLGPATRNPVHVFQTYENMLFEKRGSNLPNIEGTYLPYSDCRQSHQLERTVHPLASEGHPCKRKADMPPPGIMLQAKRGRGGHTEQQQRNVGAGKGNSRYASEMCYLYSDDASFDLETPVATHEASAAEGMYYSPMPLPMNEQISHSRNAQENGEAAATSSSMLQPEMRDPAVVTNVSDSSSYRGEDQHLRFQTDAVRLRGSSRRRTSNYASTTTVNGEGLTPAYIDIGDADWRCHWCGAAFWFGERLKSSRGSRIRYGRCCGEGKVRLQQERDPPDSIKQLFKDKHFMCHWCGAAFWFGERLKSSKGSRIRYGRCCGEGKVRLQQERDPPDSIKQLFKDKHFMENIRAYNQILYHFGGANSRSLKPEVVEQLIQILDTHHELVALFRTARDICNENDVPDFTVRLYNVDGARQYELPSTDILGAIVFESGPETNTEYDVIIHKKGERPQRINKLHSTYMALQFPLLFVYGQPGYTTKLTLETHRPNGEKPKMTMKTYYTYQIPLKDGAIFGPAAGGMSLSKIALDGVSTCHAKLYLRPQTRGHRKNTRAQGLPSEAGNVGNPTTNQSRKLRKVEIQNLNRISIELTLWDDLADKFEKQEIERLERPIIIAVTSCRALYEEKEPLCVTRYRLNDTEQEQQKNRVPFQQLFKHKAASYKATITRLNTSRGWYYTSCCVCINKVTHEDGNYKCKIHGVIPAPNYRYNFRATLTDGTGSATFIFFTPKADDFIGVNCGDLVASNQDLQRGHFPNEIEAIVGTDHTFQFHYNTTSNPGITELVMDETTGKQLELLLCITRTICIAYDNYTLTFHDAGLDSLPKPLPAPTPELKAQTTTEGTGHDDYSKGTTPLPKIENVQTKGDTTLLQKQEETPSKQEQHTVPQTETKQETTPPQAASVAMQTRSKTEMEPNVAPKTVKHRIFTEEPSENKKKRTRMHSTPTIFCNLDADFLAAFKNLPTM